MLQNHIQTITAEIVKTINSKEQENTLIREFRTRLISDVVTGKLDVREAVAYLPDESGEPGSFDVLDDLDMLTEG